MTTMSREAYFKIVYKLTGKRATVFALFDMGRHACPQTNLTIRETCAVLQWPHTTVSARIFELAEAGLIKDSGETRGGQTVWTASAPEEVEALRAARKAAKRYETGIVEFHGVGGPADHGPDQIMRVTVEVPRKVWATFKGNVRVRFI
jgi:hypothetical protein